MGSGEEATTPVKPSRSSTTPPPATTPTAQELPTTPSYADWASSVQAYYGGGAAPPPPQAYFSPSPSPHPYVWGSQHLMPPYGTPIPYSHIYPHTGMYAHPSMAVATVSPATEGGGKPLEVQDRASAKKSEGGSGKKSGDGGRATSGSGNDAASQSGDSGSGGSSDERDESTDLQDFSVAGKRSFSQTFADGETSHHIATGQYSTTAESSFNGRGQAASKLPISAPGRAAVTGPATNLNIGMDLWNASHAGPVPMKGRTNALNIAPALASSTMVGREGVMPEHPWQDERELKKQRRKQSNRESARRSRLRKQQECEDLGKRVEELNSENSALRSELDQLNKDCKDLELENTSIVQELTRLYGPGVLSALDEGNNDLLTNSTDGEGGGHVHQRPVGSRQTNGKLYTSNGKLESSTR